MGSGLGVGCRSGSAGSAGVNPSQEHGSQNGEVPGGVGGDGTRRQTDSGRLPLPLWKASAEKNSVPCSEEPLGKTEPQIHMKEPENGQPYGFALLFS